VNCPAIPGTLLESELFGYEKGAFTGAYGTKPGRVELANRGTLFLDEISELELSLQAKLLQLLQDGQFCRIGAQEDRRVEVRVVCATNRQLEQEIETGGFRQDLYYRINVINLCAKGEWTSRRWSIIFWTRTIGPSMLRLPRFPATSRNSCKDTIGRATSGSSKTSSSVM
jgi:sigma54-dependent transcription regulator